MRKTSNKSGMHRHTAHSEMTSTRQEVYCLPAPVVAAVFHRDSGLRKTLLQRLLSLTLKPFLQHYYLKSARPFKYNGLTLTIEPGVFHPGLFYSSKFLAGFLQRLELDGKSVLDMGCGSGLLSLVAAQKGANVVSVDISNLALKSTVANAARNNLDLKTIQSDLFDGVSGQFDLILVNPPYYSREPKNEREMAWYCGENFEYFKRFFAGLRKHTVPTSKVYMVLSDGCELEQISQLAANRKLTMHIVNELKTAIEYNFIFEIEPLCGQADHD